MPEFELKITTVAGRRRFDRLDEFTQGYIEALFFTEEDKLLDSSDCHPDDITKAMRKIAEHGPRFEDLSKEALASIISDCHNFVVANGALFDGAQRRAGADFWFTRNNHGCGFWDGDWPKGAEKALTDAADAYGESNVWLGANGKIYLS